MLSKFTNVLTGRLNTVDSSVNFHFKPILEHHPGSG